MDHPIVIFLRYAIIVSTLTLTTGQLTSLKVCEEHDDTGTGCVIAHVTDKIEQLRALIRSETGQLRSGMDQLQDEVRSGMRHQPPATTAPEIQPPSPLPGVSPENPATDCSDILALGYTTSGVYTIQIPILGASSNQTKAMAVYCDMNTNGGGWLVFQRRIDGSIKFNQTWNSYKAGFGNVAGEFWLGNDNLASLTGASRVYSLRVDMVLPNNTQVYAEYSFIRVAPEAQKYRLSLGTHTGTASDQLTYHSGMYFSTHDRDNDKWSGNCASSKGDGWWYDACAYAQLNSPYGSDNFKWYGFPRPLKSSQIKIRPIN